MAGISSDLSGIIKFTSPNSSRISELGRDQDRYWQESFKTRVQPLTVCGTTDAGLFEILPDTRWQQWRVIFLTELIFCFRDNRIWYAFSARTAALFALLLTTFWGPIRFLRICSCSICGFRSLSLG